MDFFLTRPVEFTTNRPCLRPWFGIVPGTCRVHMEHAMGKERITRRQKDVSRLLREKKQVQRERIEQNKKRGKAERSS
jgi:hypothetical protein